MADFVGYHVLGNRYLVVERADFPHTAGAARLLCDWRRGIGADGVLLPYWVDGVPAVRIFNADGSECRRSGNGLIITARHLRDTGAVKGGRFTVRTAAGSTTVSIRDGGNVQVSLGPYACTGPERLEVDGTVLDATRIDIGTPHCVVLTSPSAARLIGPQLAFEQRCNVECSAVLDRSTLEVEIWERGAGYTIASGAGAAAAAVAAYARGLIDRAVQVRMPGGTLRVEIADEVLLTGPAYAIAGGFFMPDLLADIRKERNAVTAE